eukprot:CAMPEP_0174818370 /NCGR_PEP_ID=MMETSP1107-20130205/1036_1 /TAXON_ID=36770 /ORGANISM="Paraphysomonas vestita, Strain GFlagA" /LENGTH=324 /DNA_ID=CAMNT_0016030117 /DNA_START=75 /DNA_END=1049 /DNA_ORIENTATION=-
MESRSSYPQIISHRGACGYLPEHSLEAHQLAINLGTDYIEPDLCLSKDGIFVLMHDITLDETTDIKNHPEFLDRYNNGYHVSDFTVAELKTLRLNQRLSTRTKIFDGVFTIPTFDEYIQLVQTNYQSNGGKTIGIYPELKQPAYHNSLGFEKRMEDMLLDTLVKYNYSIHNVSQDMKLVHPVIIQCFDPNSLQYLRNLTDIPLLRLLYDTDPWDEEILSSIAQYAQGVGPNKVKFTGVNLETAKERVQMAKKYNLAIHPYTFRQESIYVSPEFNFDPQVEAAYFYGCLEMDGLFTEFPDHMRETVNEYHVDPQEILTLGGCPTK